jgi:3-oxoacyl-[acyl-carrier-protein] synthase II
LWSRCGSHENGLKPGGLSPDGLAGIASTLARELDIGGPALTVSAACASGLVALIRGVLMLRSGEASRVLVVAAESSFHPLLLASYRRLGVLSDPTTGCRPFDRGRRGFFVGEAAAAVMLETTPTEAFSHCPGTPGERCSVDAFALGSDAISITASDPSGQVLGRLIQRVSRGRGFDLVHAHGTGTDRNDPVELSAIDSAFSEPTPVYSHKGALGHTLGASGLVSVVLNCLAHGRGLIPPNSRTPNPLSSRCAIISETPLSRPIRRSLVIATGFGGPVAVVALGRDR